MKTAPPAWLPDTGAETEALIKEARRRQHRRYLLTGVAVLVVLAGVAGVTVSRIGPPGPAAQSRPSLAPLRPAALRPAALRQVPRYFAELTRTGPVQVMGGEAAVVRSTLTGR